MFLDVSGTVWRVNITDEERRQIGRQIRDQRMREFGSKSAAYSKAGVNSATWDRIEAGDQVRDDRLIAAVKLLWPITGGNWEKIPRDDEYQVTGPVFGGTYEDPEYIRNVEQWVMELQGRIERLEQTVGDLLPTEGQSQQDYGLASRETGLVGGRDAASRAQDDDAERGQ